MDLVYARDINLGEQNKDGTYVIVAKDGTFCEPCLIEKRWGYTSFADDVPGSKCEACGS
jgi:hypothetical protein